MKKWASQLVVLPLLTAIAVGAPDRTQSEAPTTVPTAQPVPAAHPSETSAPAPVKPVSAAASASAVDAEIVKLDPVDVRATAEDDGFDATGMGSYERQLREEPFSNDLISSDLFEEDAGEMELIGELTHVASPSPVDLATGDSRLSLRGFPTPVMRNGFVTLGAPDMLNTVRTINIQGALVPVLGRAAPGGIQDYLTARPRTKSGQRADYSISSLQRQTASMELTGPLVPKKLWHRLAADWNRRTGPEAFVASETRTASGSLTWRHSPAASTLFALDFHQVHATVAPGIPEYRLAPGGRIIGPYLPLAYFNALGPEAGVRRRTTAATILFDAQPHPKVAVRAGLEAWWRVVEQDRFTTSVYNVATGRFEGTREPRHLEQPQDVQLAHVEAIGRFSKWRAEHKLMAAVSHTWGRYVREERALPLELRNQLPASVRLFDPDAPDYSRPPYSPDTYSRVLTDREERANYTAIEVSERMALARGRTVITTGVREDFVTLHLDDRKPGSPALAEVKDRVEELTYHFGVNYQALPSRLLVFASTSTALEPSTRVDARTGRIQENETTRGYEAGVKARLARHQLDFSAAAFTLFNEDISRRNPLYDDPIFDANHTQPQLVASGEERFSGGKFEGRWKPIVPLTVSARAAYTRAITTASPDLPHEVGRQMTRVPAYTASASASYSFAAGRWTGLSLGANWSYVSGYTAQYEDRQRERLDFPGYGLAGVSANYSRKRGKLTHGVSLSIRNLFDYDMVLRQARVGAGREVSVSYRVLR